MKDVRVGVVRKERETDNIDEPLKHYATPVADIEEGQQAEEDYSCHGVDGDTTLSAFCEDLRRRAGDGQGVEIAAAGVGKRISAGPTGDDFSM